jgi:hypothetical protein
MKKILILFTTVLFLSCSSDDSTAVRKITFKANGVYKVFEDIEVQSTVDYNWEVPFTRLNISAKPKDNSSQSFNVVVNRGGDFDGQSRNGAAYLNETVYYYNFENPIVLDISVNTTKRIKGTFEGVYTDNNGQDIQITNGTIDITYYPDNPQYIKK